MVEIEGLKVMISAEVKAAIENMRKFQKVMKENMGVIKELEKFDIKGHAAQRRIIEMRKNSEKYEIEQKKLVETTQTLTNFFGEMDNAQKYAYRSQTIMGKTTNILSDSFNKLKTVGRNSLKELSAFLTKFKLGWVALGVAAVGTLYEIIKQSPVLNAYMTEFGEALGYVGDTIGAIFAPFIEVALDGLWKLADWFDSQAPAIQAAIMPLLPIWQEFINLLVEAGKVILPIIVDVIAKIIKFLAELLTAIAKGDWNKAWQVISDAATKVWNWINQEFDKLLDWISTKISGHNWEGFWKFLGDALNKVWVEYIKPLLPTWLTDFLTWMKNFIEGDGKTKVEMIGEAIVNGMNWLNMAKIAASNFLSELRNEITNKLPSLKPFIDFARSGNPAYIGNTKIYKSGFGGTWQTGTAFVPSTGLYTLHRGESVIPRGKSVSEGNTINFNPTVNITGTTINSAMDVRQLAAQLTSYWRDDLQRYSRLGVT